LILTLGAGTRLAADLAWIKKIRKIPWQTPYARSTPNAKDAKIAPINISELII
jgi:hypothetical protein